MLRGGAGVAEGDGNIGPARPAGRASTSLPDSVEDTVRDVLVVGHATGSSIWLPGWLDGTTQRCRSSSIVGPTFTIIQGRMTAQKKARTR